MKYILYAFFFLILFSCNAVVNESINKTYNYLPVDSKVAILDLKHSLPENVEQLGTMSFGDNGFSIDCDYFSNLSKARKRAREIGANIVKITESKSPDFLSSCYRMKVTFYKFNGDVSNLPQIQIQKN